MLHSKIAFYTRFHHTTNNCWHLHHQSSSNNRIRPARAFVLFLAANGMGMTENDPGTVPDGSVTHLNLYFSAKYSLVFDLQSE